MSDVNLMVQELTTAKSEGVACIVDAGHPDSGRDIAFLRQASMKGASYQDYWQAGKSVDGVLKVEPAGEIVRRYAAEWRREEETGAEITRRS